MHSLFTFVRHVILIGHIFVSTVTSPLLSRLLWGKVIYFLYRDTDEKGLTVLWFVTTISGTLLLTPIFSPCPDIFGFSIFSPQHRQFFCPHPSTLDSFILSSEPTTHLARHNPSHTTFYYYTLHCVNYLSVSPIIYVRTVLHYSIRSEVPQTLLAVYYLIIVVL